MLILPRVYASIKILVFLSGQPNYQATTTTISKALGCPLPACRKLAWQLRLAGALEPVRGPRGIKLARPPSETFIGNVVRSLEEQRTPLGPAHEIERTHFFAGAIERFFEVLDGYTLMDVCRGNLKSSGSQGKRLSFAYRPGRTEVAGGTDWHDVLGRGQWQDANN